MVEGVKPERIESLIKPLKATASALRQIHNEKRVAEAEVGKCLVKVEKKKANSGNWEGGLGEEVWEHGWENSGFKGVVGERRNEKEAWKAFDSLSRVSLLEWLWVGEKERRT